MNKDILDKISEYCDIDECDGVKTYNIKAGHHLRREGFDTTNIRLFTIDKETMIFISDNGDWMVPVPKGIEYLNDCKLYKLEEIPLIT